jgi:polyhydroxyalkanoate synthesis regulator phasin
MAFKFPSLFSATDAKSRVSIVIGTVLGVIGLIYIGSHLLGGGGVTAGNAHVANAPSDLQSIPGGQLTPEYSRALAQENAQVAKQAQSSGQSAVATLVNVGDEPASTANTGANCTVVCPGAENADTTSDVNNLVKSGKITQAEANTLLTMAKDNVPVSQYAAQLDELVKEGKITPEQARKLLETYKNQHANALLTASSQSMDALIKSGKVPLAVGNELLLMQKQNVSPAEYEAELNRLVKEGKISPATAAALLAQYTQQKSAEAVAESAAGLQDMVKSGEITADVAADLATLQKRGVSAADYKNELDKLVQEGKLTPAAEAKLLAQYSSARTANMPSSTLDSLVPNPDDAANADLTDMVKSGRISPDTAKILSDLQAQNVSPADYQAKLDELVKEGKISPADAKKMMQDFEIAHLQKQNLSPADYQTALNKLVAEGKITPEQAKVLMAKYQKQLALKNEIATLKNLQANNVSPAEYTAELTKAVKAGLISPEMAARLQAEYNAATAPVPTYSPAQTGTAAGIQSNLPSDEAFNRLQQRLAAQQQQPVTTNFTAPVDNSQQFSDAAAQAAAQAQAEAEKDRQIRIQNEMAAMSGQAHSLISAWAAPAMAHKGDSSPPKEETTTTTTTKTGGGGLFGSGSSGSDSEASAAPVIKAGTIYFATLDTAVDSDFPDTPIMATIVNGPYKGGRLLGKVTINTNSVTQSPDRVSLTFNSMSLESWDASQSITAFAIDPMTARTVMASSVDYHYAKRYGAMLGSAFLSGYASAISNAGATTSTGIFGTTTTHPELSPASKIAVGLGQVGTTLGTATANYINTPPTVKVNAGVGLGILFMSDVSVTAGGAAATGGGSAAAGGSSGPTVTKTVTSTATQPTPTLATGGSNPLSGR